MASQPGGAGCSEWKNEVVPTCSGGRIRRKPQRQEPLKKGTNVYYSCPYCEMIFKYLNHFMRHLKTRQAQNPGESPYSTALIIASLITEEEFNRGLNLGEKGSASTEENGSASGSSTSGAGSSKQAPPATAGSEELRVMYDSG
jgi:hypothetical protein